MRRYFKYGFVCMVMIAMLSGCGSGNEKSLPSLTESYRKTDKLPFGSFIAYQKFESKFPDYWINIARQPFDKTWNEIKSNRTSKYSLYFLITKNLLLTIDETNAMIEYVKAGNDLFISADYIDSKLLESLYCTVVRQDEIVSEVNGKMHNTHVSMYYGNDFNGVKYSYYYFPFLNYFGSFDTSYARVLGVNEKSLPDYLVLFAGKGRLYLHIAPRIFSNYFLLTQDNYRYFDDVTAYLRLDPQYVYWDEFYKNVSSTRNRNRLNSAKQEESFSTLSVIKQNPPLLWAFYIAMAGILLFVAFNIKRKQRIIPVIKPNENSTAIFAETIGRLYLQRKDNLNIAQKMITYFFEYLRKKYFINTNEINTEFINSLSRKSEVPLEETTQLFEWIIRIQQQGNISDDELLELNIRIENFKKNKI
ncbi:MAG: hypothetical protein ABI237_13825 [Ginsengibacter sp.]